MILIDFRGGSLRPTEEKCAEGMLNRGVTLGWLKDFMTKEDCADKTTAEVVRDIVKPLTRRNRCRFVELPGVGGRRATVFASHNGGFGSACSSKGYVGHSATTQRRRQRGT